MGDNSKVKTWVKPDKKSWLVRTDCKNNLTIAKKKQEKRGKKTVWKIFLKVYAMHIFP